MGIKTLVVDDTILYRKIVSDVVSSFSHMELVGTAPSGDIALKKMALSPVDLVFCDVYMPGKNGVETLGEIQKQFPRTLVVMMSGISDRAADITVKALSMGAIDFIQKPDGSSIEENVARLKEAVSAVLRLVNIRMSTRRTTGSVSPVQKTAPEKPGASPPQRIAATPRTFGICAIGVSTGGPEALNKLIPALPATFPVPIVLVQHMPPKFTRSLAETLDKKSALHVVEGEAGQVLTKGTVYIAPGGRHMTVRNEGEKTVVALNDGPPENSCRPAVDVLFRSVGAAFGERGVLAAILTGMGSDGLNGVRMLKRKGCYCVTQAQTSCVVYGMPRAIDENGLSDFSCAIEEVGPHLRKKLNC